MVKAYLEYILQQQVAGLTSNNTNIVFCKEMNLIISASNQFLIFLDISTQLITNQIQLNKENQVTISHIQIFDQKYKEKLLAIGYLDGSIILYSLDQQEVKCAFNSHQKAISCLEFDRDGIILASGSVDNSVIIWDLIQEASVFKLQGHKNIVVGVKIIEFDDKQFVLTAAKDGLLKIWSLENNQIVDTFSSKCEEISSFCYEPKLNKIFVTTNTDELQILEIELQRVENLAKMFVLLQTMNRQSYAKVKDCQFYDKQLYILTNNSNIEVYNYLDLLKQKKQQKRQEKRMREQNKERDININLLQYNTTVQFQNKVLSIFFYDQYLIANNNKNVVEIYEIYKENNQTNVRIYKDFQRLSHFSALRALAISDTDHLILSASQEQVKVWTIDGNDVQNIRTHDTGYITCCQFLPKSRFFVTGDKQGTLSLFDINQSLELQQLKAHTKAIWSIDLHKQPEGYDGITLMTGSSDQMLKFYEFVMTKTKQMKFKEIKQINQEEEILCVKYSPDGKFYLVGLLNSVIKCFYCNSDKQFLSFYQHKLPILCIDVSSDNYLMLSASADKNVKLWGMDYGNVFKSIFAHDDAITQAKFVRETHYFITTSKDNQIKYWDGDTYECVMSFNNDSQVNCLAISSFGHYFIVGSNDKVFRLYKQTKEQVFVQFEVEKRQENAMIVDYAQDKIENELQTANENTDEIVQVQKQKYENLKYGDQIMAAIDLVSKLEEDQIEYEEKLVQFQQKKSEKPEKPDLSKIHDKSIPEFVLDEIAKIKTAELNDSLKFVHKSYIEKLLFYINFYIQNNIQIELSWRVLFFILKNHQHFILNSEKLVSLLRNIQGNFKCKLIEEKDSIGQNFYALNMVHNDLKQLEADEILNDDIFKQRNQIF